MFQLIMDHRVSQRHPLPRYARSRDAAAR